MIYAPAALLDLWESVLPFCREHAVALNGPITGHTFGARWSAVGAFMKLRRAALMLAGRRIVKPNFGKREDPALPILRRVLRDARAVSRQQGITLRVQLKLPKA